MYVEKSKLLKLIKSSQGCDNFYDGLVCWPQTLSGKERWKGEGRFSKSRKKILEFSIISLREDYLIFYVWLINAA